jgi:uncharacterized membrane protein
VAFCLAAAVILASFGAFPMQSYALQDPGDNDFLEPKSTPTGKTGKNMTVSFTFHNKTNRDLENVLVRLVDTGDYVDDEDAVKYGYAFPFEKTTGTFDPKNIGNVKAGAKKDVSFTLRVRRDVAEGYYSVQFAVAADGGFADTNDEYINIWITKSTTSGTEEEEPSGVQFIMGENQPTPYGVYPHVLNFSINLRNAGDVTAQDVNVSMNLSKSAAEFPFDINDGNYDRRYERIGSGESVEVPYSMAVRQETYSGYYPLTFTITWKESSAGEYEKVDKTFYVRIKNKDEDEQLGEFNQNDRTKARIIVDGYSTDPETIVAGQPFTLTIRMKNASADVSASNILFSLESEKVTDGAVFATQSGSSSIVVNSLPPGEVTELVYEMQSKAAVDQRPYSLTIVQKYDSPEYKNAEEKVEIDIPVTQTPRMNVGNIEVIPETITVGGECNVMFSVNNLGRVTLYNVMVQFHGDSIRTSDAYVGNLESGKTGNVDVMLTGVAATQDDGRIIATISYENENGDTTSVDKELILYVNDDTPPDEIYGFGGMDGYGDGYGDGMGGDGMGGQGAGATPGGLPTWAYIAGGAALLAIIGIVVGAVRGSRRKKKAQAELEEDLP